MIQDIELIVPVVAGLPGSIINSLHFINQTTPNVLLSYMQGSFLYKVDSNGTVYANMTGNITLNGWLNKKIVPLQGELYSGDKLHISDLLDA